MKTTIIEIIKFFISGVGIIVALHYTAFAISWGVRKGMAKVPNVNTTTVNINKIENL